jgi:hypothetical protein
VAGDLEDNLADALAMAVVRAVRARGGLAKADSAALRKQARGAAREVMGETVTPVLMQQASLAERIEWLEAVYGGGERG